MKWIDSESESNNEDFGAKTSTQIPDCWTPKPSLRITVYEMMARLWRMSDL